MYVVMLGDDIAQWDPVDGRLCASARAGTVFASRGKASSAVKRSRRFYTSLLGEPDDGEYRIRKLEPQR